MAQLDSALGSDDEVAGSNPAISTKISAFRTKNQSFSQDWAGFLFILLFLADCRIFTKRAPPTFRLFLFFTQAKVPWQRDRRL